MTESFELLKVQRRTGKVISKFRPATYGECHNQLDAYRGCYSPVVFATVQEEGAYVVGDTLPGEYPIKGSYY